MHFGVDGSQWYCLLLDCVKPPEQATLVGVKGQLEHSDAWICMYIWFFIFYWQAVHIVNIKPWKEVTI